MELALSLGGDPSKPFSFLDHSKNSSAKHAGSVGLGFCMGLGVRSNNRQEERKNNNSSSSSSSDHNLNHQSVHELDLLPLSPVNRTQPPVTAPRFRFPWLNDNLMKEQGKTNNRLTSGGDEEEDGGAMSSSPNSTTVSSFQMDFSMRNKRDHLEILEVERASDDDENGSTRKKLRLSKEQSAFLEESFKEHHTLNPKQKLSLAKQLSLRPRQVEVWFQNRRARTKLKQTEVDCEYLKNCCETLTEENRRLQKEVQELRALKTSQPFFMQLPATTLTMCPSCERVVSTKPNITNT